MRLGLLFFLLLTMTTSCITRKKEVVDYSKLLQNPKAVASRDDFEIDKKAIVRYHANAFALLPEEKWDHLIDSISSTLTNDSLTKREILMLRRHIVDQATEGDPHLRFMPFIEAKPGSGFDINDIRTLPFTLLKLNDTLIIDESLTKKMQKGDQILEINGISAADYAHVSYDDRYIKYPFLNQMFLGNCFTSSYHLKFQRNGQLMDITVKGVPYTKLVYNTPTLNYRFLKEDSIAYFQINNFSYNWYLTKKLDKFLDKVRKKNYKNVIIDIRKNPGGNGDYLDEMMSMMCPKDSLPYLEKNSLLRVSELTYKDYDLDTSLFRQAIPMPDSLVIKKIPLDKTKYKGDINYYVLISKNTGSTASSFANIMQYNGIGKLVGEPLLHNAVNFGDVYPARVHDSIVQWNESLVFSSMEYFEYSKSDDGTVYPDIPIPYKAEDYLKGGDAVLEKCIEYIKRGNARDAR